MSVSVVKITEPIGVRKKRNQTNNVYAASAAGGVAGLALRQFAPVYQQEMDSVAFGNPEVIKKININQVKKDILEKAQNDAAKNKSNEALNLFLDRITASYNLEKATAKNDTTLREDALTLAKISKQKIKEAPEAIRAEIKNLTSTAVNKVRATMNLSDAITKNAIKQQRPIKEFLLPGIALGALAGFVYDVVGAITED